MRSIRTSRDDVRDNVREVLAPPLVRNSFALILNTGLNGILGFAYWVVAARLYPADDVGGGAAAISGLILAASIGWTGLQYALLRYLAVSGRKTIRLVVAAYAIAILVAVPAAIAFLFYAGSTPELHDVVASRLLILGFIGGVVVWCLFSLQDAVLIGLRKSPWVPVENATYGVIKLALLVALAAAGIRWGLLGSWVAGAAMMVAVVSVVLFTRFLPARQQEPDRLPPVSGMARFTAGHHFVALMGGLPDTLVPILVVAMVSEQANAYYYAAWTVAFSMRLVAMNIANVLTVEGAHDVDRADHHIRAGGKLGLLIVVPMTVAALVLADWIMGLFGRGYGDAAAVLRLFALGLLPFAFSTMFVAAERVGERVAAPALVMAVSTVVTIVLDLVLMPRLGIDGAGLGWLIAQLAAAAVAGVILLRRRLSGGEAVPVTGTPVAETTSPARAAGVASRGAAPTPAPRGAEPARSSRSAKTRGRYPPPHLADIGRDQAR